MSSADLRRGMDCACELLGAAGLDAFTDAMTRVMPALLGADVAAYNETDPGRGRFTFKVNPVGALDDAAIQAFAAHAHENPLIAHLQQNPTDIGVYKITDFVAQREFRRTGLCQDVYRRVGGEYQIAMPFACIDGAAVATTFNRSRDFGARDRRMLSFLQPLLIRAYRNAAMLTDLRVLQQDLLTWLGTRDGPVAIVAGDGRILGANAAAELLLERFAADPRRPAGRVPEEIAGWLRRLGDPGNPAAAQPLAIRIGDRQLTIAAAAAASRKAWILELTESVPAGSMSLVRLGLTRREAQVLFQIVQGHGNKQIGEELGVSPRTIEKHTESILRKLNVRSRTGACAVALGVLSAGAGPAAEA